MQLPIKDTLFILKFGRMGNTPPALFSAEILHENNIPLFILEFGKLQEKVKIIKEPIFKFRIDCPSQKFLPRRVRAAYTFICTLIKIATLFLRFGKPKRILTHGISENTLAFLLHKFFRVPYICHVHEVYSREGLKGFNRILFRFEGAALRGAEFLIFPEKIRLETYKKRYQLECPIYFSANCPRLTKNVSRKELRTFLKLPPKSFLIGYCGGIGETNKICELVQALPFAPNAYFLIWGFGTPQYLNNLKDLISKLKLEKRVFLLGEVEDKLESIGGLDAAYCLYDAIELRTRHCLTASNKFMEALTMGIPVITSSQDEFIDFFKSYPVGWPLKDLNPEYVASRITELENSRLFREKASQTGTELHKNIYHYEIQFEKILNHYKFLFFGK